jgi:hypothetical protein
MGARGSKANPSEKSRLTSSPRSESHETSVKSRKLTTREVAMSTATKIYTEARETEGGTDSEHASKMKHIGFLCDLAQVGDVKGLEKLLDTQKDVDALSGDYDKRTALHLAASEGHLAAVKLLVEDTLKRQPSQDAATRSRVVNPKDRWFGTPLDDAIREKRYDVIEYLRREGGEQGNTAPPAIQKVVQADPKHMQRSLTGLVDECVAARDESPRAVACHLLLLCKAAACRFAYAGQTCTRCASLSSLPRSSPRRIGTRSSVLSVRRTARRGRGTI